jgi:hypothetical protein
MSKEPLKSGILCLDGIGLEEYVPHRIITRGFRSYMKDSKR